MPGGHHDIFCTWRGESTLSKFIFCDDFINDIVKPLAITSPSAEVDEPIAKGISRELREDIVAYVVPSAATNNRNRLEGTFSVVGHFNSFNSITENSFSSAMGCSLSFALTSVDNKRLQPISRIVPGVGCLSQSPRKFRLF
jgi:hypothetical protein